VDFIAASNNVEVTDPYVVIHLDLLYPDDQIEMSNLNIIVDPAFRRIDNAQTDANSLADLVTKKQAIAGALEKRREQSDAREHSQPGFAQALHCSR
jgi:flagellar biosynthesis chaperone FliJ